ncbi:MAG: NGG1p interacting factor NIF3 [Bacteriovoracaceae bacterium]
MFVIAVYCPVTHLEKIKEAMFHAGAGKIGNYECCSFEYRGLGQFKATSGANPFLGEVGQIKKVEEVKVEMVCQEEFIGQVLLAMKEAHPYEEPAFHVLKNHSHQFQN